MNMVFDLWLWDSFCSSLPLSLSLSHTHTHRNPLFQGLNHNNQVSISIIKWSFLLSLISGWPNIRSYTLGFLFLLNGPFFYLWYLGDQISIHTLWDFCQFTDAIVIAVLLTCDIWHSIVFPQLFCLSNNSFEFKKYWQPQTKSISHICKKTGQHSLCPICSRERWNWNLALFLYHIWTIEFLPLCEVNIYS
jgi:hypothetical protein